MSTALSSETKKISVYLLKFLGSFCLLYFGTKAMIGLCVPGGYYSPFLQRYLNYIAVLRESLLYGSKGLLSLFGYHSSIENVYYLNMQGGRSVHLVYSCLGYGIISFWLAFVFANRGSFTKKMVWMLIGFAVIWLINVTRIAMLLLAINKNWHFPLGLDHHTWFNIAAYGCIFIGIYLYDKSAQKHLAA